MTEIQTLLDRLGWSREHAARLLGRSASALRYWAEGHNSRGNPADAPPEVVAWLRACLRAVERVPLPW